MKKNLSKGYLEYIQSDKWKKKRFMALIHYGKKCDKCQATKRLDVHHLTYERFGKELLADLQILCRKCHDEVHAIKDQQKPKVKINKPSKRQKRIKKQKFKFNPNVRANRKLKKSKARKVPVGSTIVLKIRNPDPTSPHTLPARLRNKFQEF